MAERTEFGGGVRLTIRAFYVHVEYPGRFLNIAWGAEFIRERRNPNSRFGAVDAFLRAGQVDETQIRVRVWGPAFDTTYFDVDDIPSFRRVERGTGYFKKEIALNWWTLNPWGGIPPPVSESERDPRLMRRVHVNYISPNGTPRVLSEMRYW